MSMETNLLKQLDVIEGDTIYPVYIYDEGAHNKISNINSEITNIHTDIDSVENSITGITGDISHLDDELTALENSTTSAINSINNNIGNLANLDTESKINLVSAINEVLNSQSDLGYVNVKDYGATGDGITDDYTAFVNAIANTPIHGTLFIPMGLYSLSASINITKPIRILGEYSGWDVWDSNSDVTTTKMKQPLIKSNSTTWAINVKCLGFTMENISIEIVNTNNTDGCLRISNENSTVEKFNRFNLIVNSSVINNVNQSGTGISIDYSGLTELNRVTTYGFNFGIMCTQLDSTRKTNTSVIMINCWCMNYWNTGYTLTDCHYCTLIGCASDTINENQNGYNLINCFGTSLINCGAEKNKYGFIKGSEMTKKDKKISKKRKMRIAFLKTLC